MDSPQIASIFMVYLNLIFLICVSNRITDAQFAVLSSGKMASNLMSIMTTRPKRFEDYCVGSAIVVSVISKTVSNSYKQQSSIGKVSYVEV